jgi:hypothetical protein
MLSSPRTCLFNRPEATKAMTCLSRGGATRNSPRASESPPRDQMQPSYVRRTCRMAFEIASSLNRSCLHGLDRLGTSPYPVMKMIGLHDPPLPTQLEAISTWRLTRASIPRKESSRSLDSLEAAVLGFSSFLSSNSSQLGSVHLVFLCVIACA